MQHVLNWTLSLSTQIYCSLDSSSVQPQHNLPGGGFLEPSVTPGFLLHFLPPPGPGSSWPHHGTASWTHLLLSLHCTNTFTNSPLLSGTLWLIVCCPDHLFGVYIKKSEPSLQTQTGLVISLSRIHAKFFCCQSLHLRAWPQPSSLALAFRSPPQCSKCPLFSE